MRALLHSQLAAAVVGGLAVAGAFLALGVTGRRTIQTVIEQAPMSNQSDGRLTPHAIYVRDAPGVVSVTASVVQQAADAFDPTPSSSPATAVGSGFLISQDGYILTNSHLIEGADPHRGVTVAFDDAATRSAVVVGEDENDDLALLKVSMSGIPTVRPLPLGESASVRVGDPTLALGNPFGGDRTLTSGIVSALQPQIHALDGFAIDNVIQTDSPLDPRNSGGPLLNAAGQVIGINSQIATPAVGGTRPIRVAFAVPIDTVKAFIPEAEDRAGSAEAEASVAGPVTTPTMSVWKREHRRSNSAG